MNSPTRRTFLKFSSLPAVSAVSQVRGQSRQSKPNIVLLMADDLGYECLSCYGSTSYRTPNLDALAGGGVRFTQAYAQPLCTPTRVQLMTGLYNNRNWQAFGILDPQAKTFGHMMQGSDYKSCIAGKWQLYSYNPPDYEPEWRAKGMVPKDAGFDEYSLWHTGHTEDKGSRYADPTVLEDGRLHRDMKGKYGEDVFCDYINSFVERHRNQPFFAYFPMTLPHGPFMPTPRSPEWKSGNRLKADTKHYKDMVEYMDEVVGRVVGNLDRLGLRERTLVLFYSDNGTPREIQSRIGARTVQGGKGLTTDAGTRVPLIANWKGSTPSGKVLDDLIDSTDFMPTIAELTGARMPAEIRPDGRSFAPQLRGEKGNPRDWVFCHYDPRPGWDKKQYTLQRFARDQRFKLYDDGKLYDVPDDVLEQQPLKKGEGGPAANRARQKLKSVLDAMPS
jgi:arylsulfatase A-like enzyme